MLDDLLVGQKILANNLKETAKRKQLPHFQIFIDENVMNREKLFIGAGNRVSKFFLSPEL